MSTKPEWEQLADEFEDGDWVAHTNQWREEAAAELRRLGHEKTKQSEQIKALTHLVTQLHQAKGRYHTQIATCALFDAFGLSNTKPERKMK